MSTYVLIPGADGRSWYWHRLAPLLRQRGHTVVAVDLPVADPGAGLEEYAAAVVASIDGPRDDLRLVAQSLAGFTAPIVAERIAVTEIVLLNAMVPAPGESAGEWWDATGHAAARADHYTRIGRTLPAQFDPFEAFFHDVPADVVDSALALGEPVVRFDTLFSQPWPLEAWPDVPIRFIQAREDRFLPLEFQRRVVAERLSVAVEEIGGGHLVALSRPDELASALDGVHAASGTSPARLT